MGEQLTKKMSVDEFFEWQLEQDRNYELVDGVPVMTIKAMTGATDRHDRITVNAIATLHQQLRGKPCHPKTSDTSVRTFRGTRRPDLLIECGKPRPKDMAADEPRLVVEVLSPSTTRYDNVRKLTEYCQHQSIAVILLVDTEAPQVLALRKASGWTGEEQAGLDAVLDLPEIGARLPLADLYLDIDFAAA